MPERILWPGPEARGFLCLLSKFAETLMRARRHRSFRSNVGVEYLFEIIMNRYPSRLQRLCRKPSEVDLPVSEVDVLPIQLLDFIDSQPGE